MEKGKRQRRYADEQILQELAGGVALAGLIRRHGISMDTLYRWRRA